MIVIKYLLWMISFFLLKNSLILSIEQQNILIEQFRPPAIPLITFDPYMNIWSMVNNLTDDWPRLWDGTIKAFTSMIRIDGITYRIMGPNSIGTDNILEQKSIKVYPTRTIYHMITKNRNVEVILTFITPTIPTDLNLISLPITFITFHINILDNDQHAIQLYYDNTGEICVNKVNEKIEWSHWKEKNFNVMKMGTSQQNILGISGDAIGINWGYAYIFIENNGSKMNSVIYDSETARKQFIHNGTIPLQDDKRMPRKANDNWPVMAINWDLGIVSKNNSINRYLIFAYDDLYSIDWFGDKLKPYWKKSGITTMNMLVNCSKYYSQIIKQCEEFDKKILLDLWHVGGSKYATIASLAYRQTYAGCKLTWNEKLETPWYFLKEISSDGDLSTVDVIFPASPLLLYQSPELLKFLILPILSYANNETYVKYNLSWAPHHLGEYPIGNLQPYQQEQMPVEETGNLLILIACIAKRTGSLSYIYPHFWNLIQTWALYLTTALPDPGNQLCTDDFEGPSPHNVNLAAKGILGIQSYIFLCNMLDKQEEAKKFQNLLKIYLNYWIQNGFDKTHYKLQYDKSNTWSLKYNIFYQKVLGIEIFPSSVIDLELNYYVHSQFNKYGIPLDIRSSFTKLDWESWIAAMDLSKNQTIFHKIIDAIYQFANESPSRVPLTDWYWTKNGLQQGFQARPVVGGIYAKML